MSGTCVLAAEHVEGEQHGVGEGSGLLFTGEVESVHLPRVTPLVEGGRGLVILQTLHDGVVDDHLRSGVRGQSVLRLFSITLTIVIIKLCFNPPIFVSILGYCIKHT